MCKLTGTKGPGVDAHIIPKSFYGFSKDNHKPSTIYHLSDKGVRGYTSRVGVFDRTIVTQEGEAYFSESDNYAFEFLVRRGQEAKLYHDGETPLCIEISSFDYPKLKLFFLSLLWRADATSAPMFKAVSLGAHEQRIRKMILQKDPGSPEDYSVVLSMYSDCEDAGLPIADPIVGTDQETGARYYDFSLGHFVARIKVDQKPFGPSFTDFTLKPNRSLLIIMRDPLRSSPLYKHLANEVRKSKAAK